MKWQRLKKLTANLFALSTMVVASNALACGVHDQLCTYHAIGTPRTSYNVTGGDTKLIIYAQIDSTSADPSRLDFDNHVLLPRTTPIYDAIGSTENRSTAPFVVSQTSYGANNASDIWSTPDVSGAHVYPSQYQVIFNRNTSQANHTGDLNGGERGNIPNAQGCPSREGSPDCEAVVIRGNVPTGTYSQKVQMFNFHGLDNPKAAMIVGAFATGQGVLVSSLHTDAGLTAQQQNLNFANTISNGSTSQASNIILEGNKAISQQLDYHFYNRGFDPHAAGVTAFDQSRYHDRGYSKPYQVENHQTGNIDIYQNHLSQRSVTTTTIQADGASAQQTRFGAVRVDKNVKVGTIERVQPPAPYIVSDRNGIDPNDGQTSMEEIAFGFLQTSQKPSAPQAEGSQDNASGSYYHTRNALQDAERRQLEWRNGERGFASYAISSLYHGALVLPADFLYDSAGVISANLGASAEYVGTKAAQPIRSYLGKETYEVRYSDILEKQYGMVNSSGMRTAVDLVNPADLAGKTKTISFVYDQAGSVGAGVAGNSGWKLGNDVYAATKKGNVPSWSTVRSRFWKNEATASEAAEKYGAENLSRMTKGGAPRRYNADKGGVESMELSHEPVPARDGGKNFIPRWPQDHAAIDPYRNPGY